MTAWQAVVYRSDPLISVSVHVCTVGDAVSAVAVQESIEDRVVASVVLPHEDAVAFVVVADRITEVPHPFGVVSAAAKFRPDETRDAAGRTSHTGCVTINTRIPDARCELEC